MLVSLRKKNKKIHLIFVFSNNISPEHFVLLSTNTDLGAA